VFAFGNVGLGLDGQGHFFVNIDDAKEKENFEGFKVSRKVPVSSAKAVRRFFVEVQIVESHKVDIEIVDTKIVEMRA
jgi:hypothetical protein